MSDDVTKNVEPEPVVSHKDARLAIQTSNLPDGLRTMLLDAFDELVDKIDDLEEKVAMLQVHAVENDKTDEIAEKIVESGVIDKKVKGVIDGVFG